MDAKIYSPTRLMSHANKLEVPKASTRTRLSEEQHFKETPIMKE
jgi:hypothetical protein